MRKPMAHTRCRLRSLHSSSNDSCVLFCIYDAPAPEAIRKVAERNGLPVGRITEVKVLDPCFYLP